MSQAATRVRTAQPRVAEPARPVSSEPAHDAMLNRTTALASFTNRALWRKAIVEARGMLLACVALMFTFHWIFVWITSMVKLGPMAEFVRSLPPGMQNLSGVPVQELATVSGRIGLAYVDAVVLLTAAVWGISRGSDTVSGEIDRGTMEMLIAQPVHRLALLSTKIAVMIAGAAIIAAACHFGLWCGISFVDLEQPTYAWHFVPSALNLFSMTVFLCGISTAVSACDQYRWRTIGLVGGFYTLSLILNVMSRMVPALNWIEYITFFGAYEPQGMIAEMMRDPARAWMMSLQLNGILLGLGLASFIFASVVFTRRDIPAPL